VRHATRGPSYAPDRPQAFGQRFEPVDKVENLEDKDVLNPGWFTARSKTKATAVELYGAVVTAARNPWFFSSIGVPDTPEGRFEMLALMLFLAIDRVQAEGPEGEALAQRMIEAFVTDMDDCFREMGVGDLKVPKKVRAAASAFYERGAAYREAMRAVDPGALLAVLKGYVFDGRDEGPIQRLADYVKAAHAALSRMLPASINAGRLDFPREEEPL
jgi:cytochrome b pre-mRNA-processing protein 3